MYQHSKPEGIYLNDTKIYNHLIVMSNEDEKDHTI
mgnify:CR=1 FL=1